LKAAQIAWSIVGMLSVSATARALDPIGTTCTSTEQSVEVASGFNDAVFAGARRVTTPPPERPDDPPAPTASLGLRAEGPRGVYALGPATSVQVNVNASGNNILGDAANEPTIAIDRTNPNHIAIGWRQFDFVTSNFRQAGHAYSTDGGQTWTFPGVLQPGVFRSDPVMASDASGTFYFSSLSTPGGWFAAEVFRSMDGGVTWLAPVEAFGGDKQWINVDGRASGMGSGHIYQNWTSEFSCCGFSDFTRSTNLGASYQGPLSLPSPKMMWGTNDVAADGTLYIAGSALNQSGHLVTRSSNARDPGVTPTFDFVNSVSLGGLTGGFGGADDPNPVGLLGQVWIVADPSDVNRVYMLASVVPPTGNPIDVMFIRSVNKGVSWSAPVRVNDDPVSGAFHWFGTMSVAPNGRIDVVWNDSRHSGVGYLSELYYSFSADTGITWSPNVPLSPMWNSHIGWPNQNKIGDYYHTISDNNGLSIAYAATFNGEQDVYFLRIPADCNNNGISGDQTVVTAVADCNNNTINDICDVFSGFSIDCNHNLIPDECEDPPDCNNNGQSDFCDIDAGTPDCNLNGVPDSCDIGSGSSRDVNGDQIPDECEGACCQCSGSCSFSTPRGCTAVSGFFNGIGTLCGSVNCGAPNDDCADRFILPSNANVTVPFENPCATTDGPSIINCNGSNEPIGADLWYQYVAPCTGTVRASLCGTTHFDSILAVYGGTTTCDCQQIFSAPLACGDDTCGIGGGPSQVAVSATAGRCYLIRVAGWDGSTGYGELQISYDTFCESPPGDCDGDDRVDAHDIAHFQNCYTGANGGPIPPSCACVNLDGDGDVDQIDWRLFVQTITGP
jgi:hypothetical protein